MQSQKIIDEAIGWYGTIAIIGAFALISFGFIPASGIPYQLLNFSGALGIIYISVKKKVYQSVVLNIVWATIAILAILNIIM